MKSGKWQVLWGILFFGFFGRGLTQDITEYRSPSPEIVRILDTPDFPSASLSPDGKILVEVHRESMPTIKDLSLPVLRLAGKRFNPRNNGPVPGRRGAIVGFTLSDLTTGEKTKVQVPSGLRLGSPVWSPDGRYFTYTCMRQEVIELWLADVKTGHSRRLSQVSLNLASGPCQWLPSSKGLICRSVLPSRGPLPENSARSVGPLVRDTDGTRAQVRTFQDLLKTPEDVALYEFYMKAQLVKVSLDDGKISNLGSPGIFDTVSMSPGGKYLLVERIKAPFSFAVPESLFGRDVEIWDQDGKYKKTIASLPVAEEVPIGGVRTGPRLFRWNPSRPSTLIWAEALDGGDPKKEVSFRDRLMAQDVSKEGVARAFFETEYRYVDSQWRGKTYWVDANSVLISEYDRDLQWTRTWIVDLERELPPRRIWDRAFYDSYSDPGLPITVTNRSGFDVLWQVNGSVFLAGRGAAPTGERPFLDQLNLATTSTERVFQSPQEAFETVVAVIDKEKGEVLTRHESPNSPPSYRSFNLTSSESLTLTAYEDPAPALRKVVKRIMRYRRQDGVELSGMLYLPPDYEEGMTCPLLVWAYPREYNDPTIASQVRVSPNRFLLPRGPSHLYFLLEGYAVLDGAAMPVVGENGNDTFVEQLVMNAKASVDAVVRLGVADPGRIAVGGHSYGAFMAANLLAHSDLFAAGIARSGAYNRTLTPFGFQNERRTLWEAPEVYFTMSPFMHADQINEPLLLIHGQVDNNSGTFPLQSERLFHALRGFGGRSRLVMLPLESHGYAARESVLHTLAEMIGWLELYLAE